MNRRRIFALISLFLALGVAWGFVASDQTAGRLTLASVWELWTDVLRDADHFGLRLTRLTDEEEMTFGDQLAATFRDSVVRDERLQKYLDEVAASLTPHVRRKGVSYKFHIVDVPTINAFAIPGGHIYVTRWMFDFLQTEAELAALLGHEIAHVDLRHCIERFQYQLQLRKIAPGSLTELTELAYSLLTVGYSKQREHEADVRSVTLAAQAGYHPKHALAFDDRMRDLYETASGRRKPPRFMVQELSEALVAGLRDYLATHPPSGDRLFEMQRTLAKNESEWRAKRFYAGLSNHADRISRASDDRGGEWEAYEEPPAFRAYLMQRKDAPFKAFAAHLASGLSGAAGRETTPAKAIETAMSDCERKIKPCALYALGDKLVLGKTKEQIEEEKADYLKRVCSQPTEEPLEACAAFGSAKPEDAGASVDDGRRAQESGDSAIADLAAVIAKEPGRASAYKARGALYLRRGLYDCALADFSKLVELEPSATSHLLRGYARAAKGDYDSAIIDLDASLRSDPKQPKARLYRGSVYCAKRDYRAAAADLVAATKANPEDGHARAFLGYVYEARGDRKRALVELGKAIALGPTGAKEYATRLKSLILRERGAPLPPCIDRRGDFPPPPSD